MGILALDAVACRKAACTSTSDCSDICPDVSNMCIISGVEQNICVDKTTCVARKANPSKRDKYLFPMFHVFYNISKHDKATRNFISLCQTWRTMESLESF
eukprot:m.176978 g.176978  ORF g.176978 m.176978 type:complete len:100 (-) comp15451_c1_seq3:115-414(-)